MALALSRRPAGDGRLGARGEGEAVRTTGDVTLPFSRLRGADRPAAWLQKKRLPGLTALSENAFQVSALFSPPCPPAFRTD